MHFRIALKTQNSKLKTDQGFTLIETLLAVSLLCIAITAPMLLTVQALSAAAHSRDEITAYYLAQEAIEAVHSIRDGNVLRIALTSNASSISLFDGLSFTNSELFTIDATNNNAVVQCTPSGGSPCQALQSNGTLYGYGTGHADAASWQDTQFVRYVQACYIQANGDCNGSAGDEIRIKVTVSWRTASYSLQQFTISEDLYRWVPDGSGV